MGKRKNEAARGTKLDPERRVGVSLSGTASLAIDVTTSRERLTKKMFLGVEIMLCVMPVVQLVFAGAGNFTGAGIASLQGMLKSDPKFLVEFVAGCLQPFAAYILTIVYRHYADGDGGYALANLIGLLCGELFMQNPVGIAGCALLLYRTWRRSSTRLPVWHRERGVGGVLADISAVIVFVLFALFCMYANLRVASL